MRSLLSPHPVLDVKEGCVVSYCPVASAVGSRVLAEGGNSVDAAVATALALAVTYPQAGNLGGGGFMLIHRPDGGCYALDYRERAPRAITREHFASGPGSFEERTTFGALPVGVPGTVAGLAAAVERFGRFAWDRLVALTVDLAERGVWLTNRQARYLSLYQPMLSRAESTRRIFSPGGKAPLPGTLFLQPDLGRTLRALADAGPRAFYEGPLADRIARAIRRAGGVLDEADLAAYRAAWRAPHAVDFAGRVVYTPPLPSAGGFVLRAALALAEALGLAKTAARSVDRAELLGRIFRVAYALRRELPLAPEDGSPAAAPPLDPDELAGRFPLLEEQALAEPQVAPERGYNTTHFCVLDGQGGAVSNTYSLNTLFGSKLVVDGAGFLLNNSLDDFQLGRSNWHDLAQGPAHQLAPGRRPLSSMAPTLVTRGGRVEAVLGASGGPRIPTVIAQLLFSILWDGERIDAAVRAPRIHHQLEPRFLYVEKRAPDSLADGLRARGVPLERAQNLGIAAAIHLPPEGELAASLDQRFMLD